MIFLLIMVTEEIDRIFKLAFKLVELLLRFMAEIPYQRQDQNQEQGDKLKSSFHIPP